MEKELSKYDASYKRYQPDDVDLNIFVKIQIYFKGKTERKRTIKKFCTENGIEYPPVEGKHYHMPRKYKIEADEIKYLSKIKDRIILSKYDQYAALQRELTSEIAKLQQTYENESGYLKAEKERLRKIETKIAKTTNPLEKISLQSNEAKQSTKVKNQNDLVDSIKVAIKQMEKTVKENVSSWKKQVELICSVTDIHTRKYIVSVTKKIQDAFNYTIFDYDSEVFSEPVKKIINGEFENV